MMNNTIPVEIVLSKSVDEEQTIDASFYHYFLIGKQKYVAIKGEKDETFLLKVFDKEGKELLGDIKSQEEFESVCEIYRKEIQKAEGG